MNSGSNVVVYRSELERIIDQFIWLGGGWKYLLALAVVIVLAWVVGTVRDARRKGR